MKTFGLLASIAITLPLSACMHREHCDAPGWCDDNTPVRVCFYDKDCASGYHCDGGSCVARPPVPPPRGSGGASGRDGGAADAGGPTATDGGVDRGGPGTGAGGATGVDAGPGPGGAGGSNPIDARGAGGAGGSAQPTPDGGTTVPPTCDGGTGAACHPHPVAVCQFDHQCGLTGRCADGACQSACTSNASCGIGQVCTQGYCVTPSTSGGQCVFNADCGASRTCINGSCHPDCQADSDCPAPNRCLANICQPDTGPHAQCLSSGDCVGVHVTEDVCVDAVCRTACASDADCCVGSSGSVCQMGYCVTTHEVAPQCTINADCGVAGVCIDAACQ